MFCFFSRANEASQPRDVTRTMKVFRKARVPDQININNKLFAFPAFSLTCDEKMMFQVFQVNDLDVAPVIYLTPTTNTEIRTSTSLSYNRSGVTAACRSSAKGEFLSNVILPVQY